MKRIVGGVAVVALVGVVFWLRSGGPLDYEVVKSHVDETLPGNAVWAQEVIKDGKRFLLVADTFIPMEPGGGFSIRQQPIPGIGSDFPIQDASQYPVVFLATDDGVAGVWRLADGEKIWP